MNKKQIYSWALYDWANSAFATTVMAGFFPIFFSQYWSNPDNLSISTFYLGLGKEVVDALLPWEEYGSWGGDGFSKYDLGYDLAGILLAYTLDEIWKPKENSKWERGFSNTSFSVSYRFY